MPVDWLRGVYKSAWRLYADRPDVLTAGRYYFAPDDVPFLPYTHHFGSRTWDDRNWRIEAPLGEDRGTPHKPDTGKPPIPLPLPTWTGTRDCFFTDEQYANRIPVTQLVNGFPRACYPLTQDPDESYFGLQAIQTCEIQRMFARLLMFLYEGDYARFAGLLRTKVPATFPIAFVDGNDTMPRSAHLYGNNWSAIWIEGSSNFQQLALQGMMGLAPPTDVGTWSTLPLWQNFALAISLSHLETAHDVTQPIILCGHSYGGAAAAILAALYKRWIPNRRVTLLTFGIPKIGDQRLVDALGEVQRRHLCNTTDVVTVVPPNATEIAPFIPFLGSVLPSAFTSWLSADQQYRLDAGGNLTPGRPDFPDYAVFLSILTRVLAHQELSPIVGHRMSVYYDRLTQGCPGVKWPVNDDTIEEETDAFPYHLAGLGGARVNGTAIFIHGPFLIGGGGSVSGGAATFATAHLLIGGGGSVSGGEVWTPVDYELVGGGGAVSGGEALGPESYELTGAGGALSGGEATGPEDYQLAGGGGTLAGGNAS